MKKEEAEKMVELTDTITSNLKEIEDAPDLDDLDQ